MIATEESMQEFLRQHYTAQQWLYITRKPCVGVTNALQDSLERCSLGIVSKKKRWINQF